jgi:hypothetical protein
LLLVLGLLRPLLKGGAGNLLFSLIKSLPFGRNLRKNIGNCYENGQKSHILAELYSENAEKFPENLRRFYFSEN